MKEVQVQAKAVKGEVVMRDRRRYTQFQPSKSVEIRLFCIILDQKPIKIEREMTNLNMFNFDGVLRFVI